MQRRSPRGARAGAAALALGFALAGASARAVVPEPEPNDDPAAAPSLSAGGALSATVPGGVVALAGTLEDGDVDHFAFGVRADELVSVALYQEASGERDDPVLRLRADYGSAVARDDDGGPGFFARIVRASTRDETLTLSVGRFPDTGFEGRSGPAFDYLLVVAARDGRADDDADGAGASGANDVPAAAQPLPAAESVVAAEIVPGDDDFFSVQAAAGDLLTAGVFEPGAGERRDLVLRFLRYGLPVDASDDGGPGFLPNLARRVGPGEAGPWQVQVAGFPKNGARHRETGRYQLVVVSAGPPDVDPDGDGVPSRLDNCSQVPNPDQRDSDGDGFGNLCDGDLDGDGATNFTDLAILRARFFGNDPDADLDGNGVVNFADLARFRALFLAPPGPGAVP